MTFHLSKERTHVTFHLSKERTCMTFHLQQDQDDTGNPQGQTQVNTDLACRCAVSKNVIQVLKIFECGRYVVQTLPARCTFITDVNTHNIVLFLSTWDILSFRGLNTWNMSSFCGLSSQDIWSFCGLSTQNILSFCGLNTWNIVYSEHCHIFMVSTLGTLSSFLWSQLSEHCPLSVVAALRTLSCFVVSTLRILSYFCGLNA